MTSETRRQTIRAIAAAVATRRRELGWTQEKLAWEAAIAQSQVSKVETAAMFPHRHTVERLADALGVLPRDL